MIVGTNLLQLMKQYSIAPDDSYDTTCIKLSLDTSLSYYEIPQIETVSYDITCLDRFLKTVTIDCEKGYTLQPHQGVLACSAEKVCIPDFCFGLLQTKGTLARLFVFISCADGQVDPGYQGKVTFEIYNASNFKINIRPGQAVGNLYLFRTSTTVNPYMGKYQGATQPTHSIASDSK